MKKYYKRAGCFYCVTYYKNGKIKCAVAVETKDKIEIRYIPDFAESFLNICKDSNSEEFRVAGNKVINKILKAV